MRSTKLLLLFLLLPLLFLGRCIPVDGQFVHFRDSIFKSLDRDIDIKTDIEFRLEGKHGFTGLINACEKKDLEESFDGISKLQIGVYNLAGVTDINGKKLAKIPKRLEKMGWDKIVRSRDKSEFTWIYGKSSSGDCLEGLCIVHLNTHELVMVQMEGSLDKFVEREIEENDVENLKKFRL
jgi:hypothetical protein